MEHAETEVEDRNMGVDPVSAVISSLGISGKCSISGECSISNDEAQPVSMSPSCSPVSCIEGRSDGGNRKGAGDQVSVIRALSSLGLAVVSLACFTAIPLFARRLLRRKTG